LIDNVTWGFFKKFRSIAAERYRILAETVASPSLPFVTPVNAKEPMRSRLPRHCTI
jgi:hypothetical protein